MFIDLCFVSQHCVLLKVTRAFPDWSVTLSRSWSNACLAPVKHHPLNSSWWMFWSRVLLIACQTWLKNEHRLSALMRWSQDHIQSSFCSKGQHFNFSSQLSYGCNSKSFAQYSQTNIFFFFGKLWVGGKRSTKLARGKLNFLPSDHKRKSMYVFRNQLTLPFLSFPAAYWQLIELHQSS